MDNTANNEKGELFSMKKVIFIYLKDKKKEKILEGLEFTTVVENSKNRPIASDEEEKQIGDAKSFLDSKYTSYSGDFLDIVYNFGAKELLEICKDKGNEYTFYKADVEFLCELFYKYENSSLFKQMCQINNDSYDGFVRFYQHTHSKEIIDNLEFVINGFIGIVKKRGKHEGELEAYRDYLVAHTQLKQIKWIYDMENIFAQMPKLTKDDVEFSFLGIIRDDYGRLLEDMGRLIKAIVERGNSVFEEIKEYRRDEISYFYDKDAFVSIESMLHDIHVICKNVEEEEQEKINESNLILTKQQARKKRKKMQKVDDAATNLLVEDYMSKGLINMRF